MGAISGDVNTNPMLCVNDADLASRPVGSKETGDFAYVSSHENTPEGPLFFYRASATNAASSSVVVPTGQATGRWLSYMVYGSSGGLSGIVVTTRALLSAVDSSALPPGTQATVNGPLSANSFWTLVRSASPAAPDGTCVLAGTGNDRWQRLPIALFEFVSVPNTWYVDAVNGNDEALGAITSPIKTLREWFNRTNARYTRFTLMQLIPDPATNIWPASDPWVYGQPQPMYQAAIGTTTPFALQGTLKVLASGTYSAITAPSTGVADGATTATDVAGTLAANVGKEIITTSGGANGYRAWVENVRAGNQVRTSVFVNQIPGSWFVGVVPAPGDTFNVVSQTQLDITLPAQNADGIFIINDIDARNNNVLGSGCAAGSLRTWWGSCLMSNGFDGSAFLSEGANGGQFMNCQLPVGASFTRGSYNIFWGGSKATISAVAGARVYLQDTVIDPGGAASGLQVGAKNPWSVGGFISLNGGSVYNAAIAFDAKRGGCIGLRLTVGTGNTVVAAPRAAGKILPAAGTVPLTTGGTEVSFVDGATILPPLVAGAFPGANAACATWANWAAAPFNSHAMSFIDYGAIIAG